jgi:diguanylate cyclase (GGDEF)-like protein
LGLPPLLAAEGLAPAEQWQLLDMLYGHKRSLIEGGIAFSAVGLACMVQTGLVWFGACAGTGLLVLMSRLALAERFHEYRRAHLADGTVLAGCELGAAAGEESVKVWARRFTWGVAASAFCWGLTDLCVFTRSGDVNLQLFLAVVQSVWLANAGLRNAASPAAVLAQASLSILPTMVACAIGQTGLFRGFSLLWLVAFSATLSIARHAGDHIVRLLTSEHRLEEANARLEAVSATDALTGIANRRAFETTLHAEWARALRDGSPLGLLLMDVDDFKLFNDRYGHPAGDACLRLMALQIQRCLRQPPDLAARYGGEEFVALLPGLGEARVLEVAERVRRGVLAARMAHGGSRFGVVTLSIGAASLRPQDGGSAEELVELADRALYAAKRQGRNKVRLGSDMSAVRVV